MKNIKKNNEKVVFISGHFNNFELMAMQIEKAGVDCAAIYRPLNNPYLNSIMETIRTKDICKIKLKKEELDQGKLFVFCQKVLQLLL